ncbi:MAG: dihydrofolate reductase family protein [Syntrophaceae bacterium]|nr:dihydrofolate reductase family protein [Syntrophaceae bacterium]
MGQLTLFMHISLDGFAAGPNGQMDWIHVDDEIFDHGADRIYSTDFALYGRKTFQLMESYWPTAAEGPDPTKHTIEHSRWYKDVRKVVLSNTMKQYDPQRVQVINSDLAGEIKKLKTRTDMEILIFGSPTAGHSLLAENLVDNFWFNVNPVLIGSGIPVFRNIQAKRDLKLIDSTVFSSGVVCLNYSRKDS